jgi:HTH-type transcriptional regulator/antitoxin HigA
MTVNPIKTKKDYTQALERPESIVDAKKGSRKGDEPDVLSILIEKYEDEHFTEGMPDPVEAIKFRMEQLGSTKQPPNILYFI